MVNKNQWARGIGPRLYYKLLPALHSGNFVIHTATQLGLLKLPLPYTETYIRGQKNDEKMRIQDLPS